MTDPAKTLEKTSPTVKISGTKHASPDASPEASFPKADQRSMAGNQAMQHLARTRVTVSQPGDEFEREANRRASEVVSGRASKPGGTASGLSVQRKAEGGSPAARSASRPEGGLRSSGQMLDRSVRSEMESGFGADFSDVRVHTDDRSAQSARSLGALAYTSGRDVVFNSGQYAPHSAAGRFLLAHELAHVVQQTSSVHAPPAGTLQRLCDPSVSSCAEGAQLYTPNPLQSLLSSQAIQSASPADLSRIPDDFDPCSVAVSEVTNAQLLSYWTSSDAYLKARKRGDDRYYDYANLLRRLVTERRRRAHMGHAWLGSSNVTSVPARMYQIIPGPGLTASIVIADSTTESGMPVQTSSAVVTPEQFTAFLSSNNIPQMNVEDWYARQGVQDPEQLTVNLPPPPVSQTSGLPGFVNPFFESGNPFGSRTGYTGSPAGLMGMGASGMTASPFDLFGRSQFLRSVYTPGTTMTNPRSVAGAELNWRGAIPEISQMYGTYGNMIRYQDLNRIQQNAPVFDTTTRAGQTEFGSITHTLPNSSGQVDMSHYAEKFRIMTGDYDPKGTNVMGQSLTMLNREYGTSLTVADINERNVLRVPDDHISLVQDAIEARIARSPTAYSNLVDAMLRTDPITLAGTRYTSWNQLQSARTNNTINNTDWATIRRQLGLQARGRVAGNGMTTPEIQALEQIRTSMQLAGFSEGQTSVIATPEMLQMRRLMATGMSQSEAINTVAGEGGIRGGVMGTAISLASGIYHIATSDNSDPNLWQRTGLSVPIGFAGGYGQAYLDAQITSRLMSPILTEATAGGAASTSVLTSEALLARGAGGFGAGAVIAPVVTWLSMAGDEAFFGAYYTRIDYAAKGARSAVAGGLAAGGGALAAGGVGALAGTEVPILGNIVGFCVGIGIYYLVDSSVGDDIEGDVRESMGEQGCVASH